MPYAIRAGEIQTRLDDLPIGEFQQVAKRHGLSWFDLWNTPAQEPEAFYELVELAVRHGGGTLPQRPVSVSDTLALISDCLQIVDDDMPTMWEDGNPQEAGQNDSLIVWAARTYGWPPTVIRQQSWRDLMLLNESYE